VLAAQIRHRSAHLGLLEDRRIWLSVNFDRFMQNFLQVRKFYFSGPQLDGGIAIMTPFANR